MKLMETTVFSGVQAVVQLLNLLLILLICYMIVTLFRRRSVAAGGNGPSAAPRPLGEVLRDRRLQCGLTQEFVAEQLGVSRQAVSKWESGASLPSTANLLALASLLKIPGDELLRKDG